MIDDLVKRLRKLAADMDKHATYDWDEHEDVNAACDRIEALEAQLATERAAAAEVVRAAKGLGSWCVNNVQSNQAMNDKLFFALDDAITAYEAREGKGGQGVTAKYGRRNIVKMYRQLNDLRAAIRAEGTPAIQEAFDYVDEWSMYLFRDPEQDSKNE